MTVDKAIAKKPKTEELAAKADKQDLSPLTLIQMALQSGADIDKLEKLMAMQERWEAQRNRKLFFQALAEFQSLVPVITKNKTAGFEPKNGGRKISYSYASLDQIVSDIKEPLKKVGLTYRWEITDNAGQISATCIVTHVEGHQERTTMAAGADTTGSKNDIQAKGSTVSYMQRYSLIGALGLSTAQDDVDGHKKEETLDPEIQKIIDELKRPSEVNDFWVANKQFHGSAVFKAAIDKKGIELMPIYLGDLLEEKRDKCSVAAIRDAERIIKAKEVNSYQKLKTYLTSL